MISVAFVRLVEKRQMIPKYKSLDHYIGFQLHFPAIFTLLIATSYILHDKAMIFFVLNFSRSRIQHSQMNYTIE